MFPAPRGRQQPTGTSLLYIAEDAPYSNRTATQNTSLVDSARIQISRPRMSFSGLKIVTHRCLDAARLRRPTDVVRQSREGLRRKVLEVILIQQVSTRDSQLPGAALERRACAQELDRIHDVDVGCVPVLLAAIFEVDTQSRFILIDGPFLLRAQVELIRHGLGRLVADGRRNAKIRIEVPNSRFEQTDIEVSS